MRHYLGQFRNSCDVFSPEMRLLSVVDIKNEVDDALQDDHPDCCDAIIDKKLETRLKSKSFDEK